MWGIPKLNIERWALEGGGIEAPISQAGLQVFPPMQPLAASCDLDAVKQQIEAIRRACCASWRCVKCAVRERESQHENGWGSSLFLGQPRPRLW
jgi:hypothetical protein